MEGIKGWPAIWMVIVTLWVFSITYLGHTLSGSIKYVLENSTDNWKVDREQWTEIKNLYVEQQNIMSELKAIKECQ